MERPKKHEKRINEATENLQRMEKKIKPFLKRRQQKLISTADTWQKTSVFTQEQAQKKTPEE